MDVSLGADAGTLFQTLSHLGKNRLEVFPGGHSMCKGWGVWKLGGCVELDMAGVPWGRHLKQRSPGQGLYLPGKNDLDLFYFSVPSASVSSFPSSCLKIVCT